MKERNPFAARGDYGGDMRDLWSPADTESALRGRVPVSGDLARLVPALSALRARGDVAAEPATVTAMASILAREAQPTPRVRAARVASPWRRRIAFAGLGALLASAGVAGAAAADAAAPGDALYGLDQALERIGIGDGGSHERIEEAGALADEGEVDAALHHAAEALDAGGDASSASALLAAADTLTASGNATSAEVHARVSEMLRWMGSTDAEGSEFGRAVSEYARDIGGDEVVEVSDGSGPEGPGDVPGEPGNSGNAGRPGSAGKPDATQKDDKTPSGASEDSPGRGHGG